MRSIIVTSCLALLVLGTGVAGPTRAQDIDLFMGPPPTATNRANSTAQAVWDSVARK